ncbi:fibronectin type III domain-containing protein [Robertkochia sediminum]|uniref:fibronectin type III domain-containing protein n=1 Tax=Robertkochia sediminum TaxID=2785326 RepID=UPI001932A6E2|nr:fibronectin type III domain-containing protein [Robertkochia sediminum]MBL7472334.1 fibronectin type III domain-containing protein [Robertkochia sediminum]
MKKLITSICILGVLLTTSCGGDGEDAPSPPTAPQLSFPENNSECFEGTISQTDPNISEIVFRWERSSNTVSYTIRVLNLLSGRSEVTETTTSTSIGIALERGMPYMWSVTASGSGNSGTAASESWRFFNAGDGVVAHAPFPADLIYPSSGANLNLSGGSSLELRWEGADVDGDIGFYEVLLDTQDPPAQQAGSTSSQRFTVNNLSSGSTYYWRVITTDLEGNSSTSEVSQFVIAN